MRFYLLVFILFFYGASTQFIQAQNTSNEVNLSKPDKAKLEWLTFESVNTLREKKKLPNLVWDAVLYRAAIDHAEYLIHEEKISHNQTLKGKKTPTERVKIHGGITYTTVGENIVEITLGVQIISKGVLRSTVTYESAASAMAALWKSSPGHYSNIISKNYNCTALAVSYDSLLQRLIAVQVFGYSTSPATPSKLPDYSNHLLNLPDPKLSYGLKSPKLKSKKSIDGFLKMTIDRGYITCTYKEAKKIFKGGRSGITQEFIPLSQFDSISTDFSMVPNRRNGLFELNGSLSKPIYRRQLLKYSRKAAPPEYYIDTKFIRCFKKPPQYFIYPMHPNGPEVAFNIFLIKNKHLEVYRTYCAIPTKLLETPFPNLAFIKPFKAQVIPDKYRIYNTYDTLKLKLYYSSSQVILDSAKQDEISKGFNKIKGKITSVAIAAFASVDGEKASNDAFAKARMDNFIALVKPYLDTIAIQPKLIKQEQWKLFYKQLVGTRLQFLKKMKPDEIRNYVNEHTSDILLSDFLDKQRYLDVTLTYRQEFKEKIISKTPIEIFDSLKLEYDKTEAPKQELINAIEKAQLSVYNEWSLSDSLTKNKIILPIPDSEKYPAFKYNELMYQYTVLRTVTDKDLYDKLQEFGRSEYFPVRLKNELIYNNLVLIYRQYNTFGDLNGLMDYNSINNDVYRNSKFFLKNSKKKKYKKNSSTALYRKEYFVLKELPAFISLGNKLQMNKKAEDSLWKYYYVYTIHSL